MNKILNGLPGVERTLAAVKSNYWSQIMTHNFDVGPSFGFLYERIERP